MNVIKTFFKKDRFYVQREESYKRNILGKVLGDQGRVR